MTSPRTLIDTDPGIVTEETRPAISRIDAALRTFWAEVKSGLEQIERATGRKPTIS